MIKIYALLFQQGGDNGEVRLMRIDIVLACIVPERFARDDEG